MNDFNLANQARLSIKMLLSNYYWFMGTAIIADGSGWAVVVYAKDIDDKVRKIVPSVHKDVSVIIGDLLKKGKER
jgi:hypothetical protein